MYDVKVSVVIKALNEEANIARTIESALRAVAAVGGEVILADSLSTDRTVEIASRYPIRIVQLKHAGDRCCGVGAQLGYQYARGEYVYILDGDMEMYPEFLPQAMLLMTQHPKVAGVGGRVVERNLDSLEFQARVARAPANLQPGEVDRLDGGGLYRRTALEQLGYLTNRNLHGYEEFDLAVRLRVLGFKLRRIAVDAVDHYGHTTPAYALLMRRWRSRYICGVGEVLRGALGKPHIGLVLRELKELRLYFAVGVWWFALMLSFLLPLNWPEISMAFSALLLFPWAVMALKKRSVRQSTYSIVSWCFHAAGLLRGLVSSQRSPYEPVAASLIRDSIVDSMPYLNRDLSAEPCL